MNSELIKIYKVNNKSIKGFLKIYQVRHNFDIAYQYIIEFNTINNIVLFSVVVDNYDINIDELYGYDEMGNSILYYNNLSEVLENEK